MSDLVDVTLITTENSMNVAITKDMLSDLALMLRTEDEPVAVHMVKKSVDVVGILIRSKSSANFPRVIYTGNIEKEVG